MKGERQMNIFEFEKILNMAVKYLTNDYTKSKSVCDQYLIAKRIMSEFINIKKEFKFEDVLNWIKENQVNWYKGKFKVIKRLAYSIYDYECNNKFTTSEFVYYNTNELILFLADDEVALINDYILKSNLKGEYQGNIRNCLSHFFLYIKEKKLIIDNLTLVDFENLYYELKQRFLAEYFNRTIGHIKKFVNYYSVKKNINIPMSFILNNYIMSNLKYLRSVIINDKQNKILIDKSGTTLSSNMFSDNLIDNFIAILKSHNYSKSVIMHIKSQIRLFHMFLNIIDYKYSLEILDYWINSVIKVKYKGYKATRNIVLRYIDYINGRLDIKKIYNKLNKFDSTLPTWCYKDVESYLTYRKRTGCVDNTITNDKCAILSFCLFLDSKDIKTFELINHQLLIDYTTNMYNKSLEGKNNYISRVKSFVSYLQDKKIIPLFNLASILEGNRVPKKIVSTLETEVITKIYNLKDNLKTDVELRSYAIFIIGIRLGLRSLDIVNLKFENVSFKNMTISFIQSKTKRHTTLPLPIEVANAIYNYVKYGRTKCDNDYIFIQKRAPYLKLSRTACGSGLQRLIKMTGFTSVKAQGFHILRRTYASTLLKTNKTTSSIALALGHSTNGTVHKYLNINKSLGYTCPLELTSIEYRGKEL